MVNTWFSGFPYTVSLASCTLFMSLTKSVCVQPKNRSLQRQVMTDVFHLHLLVTSTETLHGLGDGAVLQTADGGDGHRSHQLPEDHGELQGDHGEGDRLHAAKEVRVSPWQSRLLSDSNFFIPLFFHYWR